MFLQPRPSCRRGAYHLEDTISHCRTSLTGWSVLKSLRQHSGFKRSRQPCEPLQQQNRQSKTQGEYCTSFWRLTKCYTDLISRSPMKPSEWLWDTDLARPSDILTHASVEVKSTPGVYMVWLARRVRQDTSAIRCWTTSYGELWRKPKFHHAKNLWVCPE